MKKIPVLLLLSIVLIVANSCKNFLNIPTEDKLPIDYQKPTTPDQAFQYVSACYAGLRKWGVSAFPFIGLFEITSDDADKGSTPDDSPSMLQLDNFTFTVTNDLILTFWTDNYSAISNCNNAINTLQTLILTDTVSKQQLIAEAKYLRAFLYLHLNLVFGGVPIVDTTLTAAQFAKVPRASSAVTYQFIENDLRFAIQYLPESYTYDQAGRATKYAAEALLARTCMYESKWQDVKTLTDDVIASGLYLLYPDFYRLFRVPGENSSESVFELQLSSVDQGRYRCDYGFVQGPRNNFPKLQGWGFCVPSNSLISFLDARKDSIRKSATILYRGTRTRDGDSIDIICPNPAYNYKVYEQQKYNIVDYALDHNIRFIRYAEVLLMNSEAALMVGGDAASPLNQVRKRAGLPPLSSPTLQDIWNERRAEFALEEFRFYDLIRTHQAATVLAAKGFVAGKNELFPIPQTQIDLSNGVLTQNPGY